MSVVTKREFEGADPLAPSLRIERYLVKDSAFAHLPWRKRLAWSLRILANRVDRQLTFTIKGHCAASITNDELWDAMAYGLAASQQYLADLTRERMAP